VRAFGVHHSIGGIFDADISGFLQGLRDQGYVEGQNMTLELRFANGSPEKLG
jgi:hypothetical protein